MKNTQRTLRTYGFIGLALSTLILAAQSSAESNKDIDAITDVMTKGYVPGISLAKIENNQISATYYQGVADTSQQSKVLPETAFQAASLTKPVFAYIVWELSQRGEFDIDKPLSGFMANERIPNKEFANQITARYVLSHQTGLPNWGGDQLSFDFQPGTDFRYSGESYVYLQQVLEKITGKTLQQLGEEIVFTPLNMPHSKFTWNEGEEFELASGHSRAGSPSQRFVPSANAASSLHTTAEDYAKFMIHWMKTIGSSDSPFAKKQITLDGSERGNEISSSEDILGWGLGWGTLKSQSGEVFWHWGDNGVFRAFVAMQPSTGDGFVYFANSQTGLAIIEDISTHFFSVSMTPIVDWLGYPQSSKALWQSEQQAYVAEEDGRYHEAIKGFATVLQEYPDHRWHAKKIVWLQDLQRAKDSDAKIAQVDVSGVVGQYGPRTLFWKDGALYYQREGREPLKALLIDENTIGFDGVTTFRLEVEKDNDGNGTKLIGHYFGGGKDESPRTVTEGS